MRASRSVYHSHLFFPLSGSAADFELVGRTRGHPLHVALSPCALRTAEVAKRIATAGRGRGEELRLSHAVVLHLPHAPIVSACMQAHGWICNRIESRIPQTRDSHRSGRADEDLAAGDGGTTQG